MKTVEDAILPGSQEVAGSNPARSTNPFYNFV